MAEVIDRPQTAVVPGLARPGLCDAILGLILSRALPVGEETSEDRIRHLLGQASGDEPSRTPVRIALAVLQEEGFVIKRPQIGCLVVPVEPDEVDEIFNLRLGFERDIFPALAQAGGRTTRDQLDGLLSGSRDNARSSSDGFLIEENVFHASAARLAGYSTAASLLRDWGDRLRVLAIQRESAPGTTSVSDEAQGALRHDHHTLLDAIGRGDAEHARECVTDHLQRLEALFL